MYVLDPAIKRDPERRWALPDRIFFGHGACHILAGVYLLDNPIPGFHAEKISPADGYWGNHVYVTDGKVVFDYHGYSLRERLLEHYWRAWSVAYPGWSADIDTVDYNLLDTAELNARKMLGPNQYLHNAVRRARQFLSKRNHLAAYKNVLGLNGCL